MTILHVLVTGISLPVCCHLQRYPHTCDAPSSSDTSRLLAVKSVRINSIAGLSYIAWKCTSLVVSCPPSNASLQPNTIHSQWIAHPHISVVCPASSDANTALDRGSHDSKFEIDNPRVELWSSLNGSMGRFSIAKQCIRIGEQAIEAAAFAVVVRQSLTHRRCHWCFALLRTKALQCGDCAFTRYCSRDCLVTDAPLHEFQCKALRDLQHFGCDGGGVGDVETLRLALAVLSMEHFVQNSQALRLLCTHAEGGDDTSEVQKAVEFIIKKTNHGVDRKHVLTTLQRVRCNAHPIYLDGVTCVGSGVFPEAAMALNHSCLPNVVPSFNSRTRTLAFHAIADIPRGYAIECAYIDVLQARKRRQELLDRGFGFTCVCKRCTREAALHTMRHDKAAESEEANVEEETQVMKELMQLVNSGCSSAQQRLACLTKEYASLFKHNSEAQFALYTTEMQLARDRDDWNRVMETAEILLKIWSRCGLPDNYHTTETLHVQIYYAAKNAGMMSKAKTAAKRVASIRQICGYSHSETVIE
ncbi:unnamed protein product [Peronospora belbahrii]|uniref:MYND-type domain-containing protein n=2 Tax=Peronospora belbahrii TaxID=622444 RepID=A0ABN8CTW1_9STRA|nr:unnamed protein product [Peronospora belbahrii]